MLRLAFYTCFYGSDSNRAFKIPEIPSLKYPCYYYTNNRTILELLAATKWKSFYDNKPTTDDRIESCMAGKHIKAMPQEYPALVGYDYLCFLDSKLDHVDEHFVERLIARYFIKQNHALLLREHWFIRNSVWNEFTESMKQERYRMQQDMYKRYIDSQVRKGLSATTEHHCACNLLIRNMKHERIKELNTTWYAHIQECGIQDQISFFFVKQLFPQDILSFTESPFVGGGQRRGQRRGKR